jgi:hypothetical protein
MDDCQLVSAGRERPDQVWLFSNGADTFVTVEDIVDAWEGCPPARSRMLDWKPTDAEVAAIVEEMRPIVREFARRDARLALYGG